MKKQIKVQETESGLRYFIIFEVHVKKHNGEVVVKDRFFSEKDALKDRDFVLEDMSELYKCAWVVSQIVWC